MRFCLSLHRAYVCRHAGACCEQDWLIPVEPQVVEFVRSLPLSTSVAAVGRGGGEEAETSLRRSCDAPQAEGRALRATAELTVARDARGACVFFDAEAGRLCRIHSAGGPMALPSACRHFPRVVLRDDRGVFLSLSHFCPTAARLLLDDEPPAIIAAPDALGVESLEGFDAAGAWPPLLRPGLLMDLEGYGAWEAACVAAFARTGDAERGLAVMAAATERIRTWRPGRAPLREWVADAFERSAGIGADPAGTAEPRRRVARLPMAGQGRPGRGREAPEEIWARGRRALEPFARAAANYLAARVFACSIAYEGEGLRTVVEWLRTCLAILQREAGRRASSVGAFGAGEFVDAVRQADLVLLHQADTRAFARRAARTVEGGRE